MSKLGDIDAVGLHYCSETSALLSMLGNEGRACAAARKKVATVKCILAVRMSF